MNKIMAYFILNLKMLSKDRLPLVWSVCMPAFFLIINQNGVGNLEDLRYWWSYIILTSYIYGVGLHALTQREYGTLKTAFSIERKAYPFFIALLLTQLVYSFVCILLFNVIAFAIYRFSIIDMQISSIKLIFMLIPVALGGCAITLIKKVHVNSLSTMVNIVLLVMFTLLNTGGSYNQYNPLTYLSNLLVITKAADYYMFFIWSIVMVITGIYSIYKFQPIPMERR